MQPVEVFPQGHPVLSRSDCDGAPGSNAIPGEGKLLGQGCSTKKTGGELFYSYDAINKKGRTQLARAETVLMYVVRDSYERAYLVVSLGAPNLNGGFLQASTILKFKLLNVNGDPSPIVLDDPASAGGDQYAWDGALV